MRSRKINVSFPARQARFAVYVYCAGTSDIFEYNFADVRGVSLKAIPQPILEIYKSINGENMGDGTSSSRDVFFKIIRLCRK